MPSLLGSRHNNQVLFFDPGCATLNVGDEIISDSARHHLAPLFNDKFIVRLSTHQRRLLDTEDIFAGAISVRAWFEPTQAKHVVRLSAVGCFVA